MDHSYAYSINYIFVYTKICDYKIDDAMDGLLPKESNKVFDLCLKEASKEIQLAVFFNQSVNKFKNSNLSVLLISKNLPISSKIPEGTSEHLRMPFTILEFKKKIACSKDVALWNYWDYEHLDNVHGGYKKSDILYDKIISIL